MKRDSFKARALGRKRSVAEDSNSNVVTGAIHCDSELMSTQVQDCEPAVCVGRTDLCALSPLDIRLLTGTYLNESKNEYSN